MRFLILFVASALHIVIATLLLVDSKSIGSTPSNSIIYYFNGNRYVTAGVLYIASLLVLYVIMKAFHRVEPFHALHPTDAISRQRAFPLSTIDILLLLPQQFLLLGGSAQIFIAVLNGRYADGTIRNTAFIASDQAAMIIVAIAHSIFIIWLGYWVGKRWS